MSTRKLMKILPAEEKMPLKVFLSICVLKSVKAFLRDNIIKILMGKKEIIAELRSRR